MSVVICPHFCCVIGIANVPVKDFLGIPSNVVPLVFVLSECMFLIQVKSIENVTKLVEVCQWVLGNIFTQFA